MADESPEHSTICINLLAIVGSQLRGTPCQVFASDTKVRCGPAPRPGYPMKSLFAYPDLFRDLWRAAVSMAHTAMCC